MNIFLTGASSGIGEALAREFASKGATLGLVARNPEKLEAFVKTLPHPERHFTYACDVCDREKIIQAARQFDKDCGGADIVIANAGISVGVKTQYYEDLEQFEKVFQTNVIGMANTFHPFPGRRWLKREEERWSALAVLPEFAAFPAAKPIAPVNQR